MHASSFYFIASSYNNTMRTWVHGVMFDGNKSTNNNPTYINQCCRYLLIQAYIFCLYSYMKMFCEVRGTFLTIIISNSLKGNPFSTSDAKSTAHRILKY